MRKEVFYIWENDPTVTLTVFGAEQGNNDRPAVIVVPGGAYIAPAAKEADPVAQHFAEMGYLGCVLRASTLYRSHDDTTGEPNPHTLFPEPMLEMACAIKFLREHTKEFCFDVHKLVLMGFSAGGHLVMNYANYWHSEQVLKAGEWSEEDIRPNACVLCYGATKLVNVRGSAMLKAVFGGSEWTQEQMDVYNGALHVNERTPPCFLWHTADDQMVPVEQSYRVAQALCAQKIPHELHVFCSGPHAAALSKGLPAERWPKLADTFLERVL